MRVSRRRLVGEQKVGDERRELRVVPAHRLFAGAATCPDPASRTVAPPGSFIRMMFERSSVTRIGSATFSRMRLSRSRSPAALTSACRTRWTCRSSSCAARRRSVTSRSTDSTVSSGPTRSPSGCASTSNRRSLPFVRVDEVQLARPSASAPPITARERNDVNNRLFSSTARRRPGVSSSRREEMLGALVLRDDVVGRVRDHDRIGQRVDHEREPIALPRHPVALILEPLQRRETRERSIRPSW